MNAGAADGPAAAKAALRAEMRAWRRGLAAAEILRWSEAIERHLRDWPPLAGAATVLGFASLRREPQVAGLLAALRAKGHVVALPEVAGARIVPTGEAGPLPVENLEAVLVPGLAFDALGRRLGRGGGHYDRLLGGVRRTCLRVGLCFDGQRVERVPIEPWDQAVDAVVTESGVWERVRGGRST